MNNLQRGLGRGLDALFGEVSSKAEVPCPPATSLPLNKIIPNPSQPRRHFAREALDELAASIRSQGIIQPLLVRPKPGDDNAYELIAGERRWRAAELAGLEHVPVFVRPLEDHEVMLAALIENLQREDLNPMEEALALQTLREQCSLTQEEMAARLGKSRSAIANTLRLLALPMAAQEDLRHGRMSAGHARALMSVPDPEAQEALRQAIVERQLSVRETEQAAAACREGTPFPWQKQENSPSVLSSASRAPRSHVPALKTLQQMLRQSLNVKVRINGSEERGLITLAYANPDELARLMQHLGIETDVFDQE